MMVTELLRVKTHQELQALEDEVGMKMGLAYIRLDWMPGNEQPFEAKAFVLRQLKAMHTGLCNQHIHAPTKPPSGDTGSSCAYCSYGHRNVTIAAQSPPRFGVKV